MESSELAEEDESDDRVRCSGFRVKYLGCATFGRKRGRKRIPKGISSMQRPLLEVYASARKRGEVHRSAHLMALDQRLDVLHYGLVVAQRGSKQDQENLVLVKVLTPLSNAVLWAAVRFQARALRKRVFGAAFVPIACCDGVLDREGYLRLDAKHRFLVSLSHPSVFACVFRRMSDPSNFECHAFACASAHEALALGSAMSSLRGQCDMPPMLHLRPGMVQRVTAGHLWRPVEHSLQKNGYEEDESNSYASVQKTTRPVMPVVGRSRKVGVKPTTSRTAKTDQQSSSSSGVPSKSRTRRWVRASDVTPSTSSGSFPPPSSDASSSSPQYLEVNKNKMAGHREAGRRRDMWTMTEGVPHQVDSRPSGAPPTSSEDAEEEELVQTIDLSSESSNGSGKSTGHRLHPRATTSQGTTTRKNNEPQQAPVKYTYFGYETFRPPTWTHDSQTRPQSRPLPEAEGAGPTIQGNGTGRITITVPFSKQRNKTTNKDVACSSSSGHSSEYSPNVMLLPVRGVRSFRSDRRVGDWSTLSHTTSDDASIVGSTVQSQNGFPSNSSSSSGNFRTRSRHHHKSRHGQKMLRWRSEDRLSPHRNRSLFSSLKVLSLQSLTKAKHKTGKFISSMRTKLMGSRKSPEGSEDSAYDTSEVCLSPTGRSRSQAPASGSKARRQQSWSFHDLRTSASDRETLPKTARPVFNRTLPTQQQKRRTRHRRHHRRNPSSSDSGVEEFPSDSLLRRSGSDMTDHRVTRVEVHHGMGTDTFHRWSHTNLQDELGYIP